MGYYGKLEIKNKAIKLRKQGKSYSEIIRLLNVSKSTLSYWCRDIRLTKRQMIRLYESKKKGALKGSIIASLNKVRKRKISIKFNYLKGMAEVGKLNKRDRFIAGIAFYSAEGTKSEKGCAFANSDPKIIIFMVKWFKEFGKVAISKFRGAIWIHSNLSESKAKNFWESNTGIPISQFYKTYFVKPKLNSNKIRKNIHDFGVFTIYVSDVNLARRLNGWIGGVIKS